MYCNSIYVYTYRYSFTLEEGPPLGNVFLLDLAFDVGFLVHRRLHSATIFREIYAKIGLKSSIWGHMCMILVTLGVHWGHFGVQGSTFYGCEAREAQEHRPGAEILEKGLPGGTPKMTFFNRFPQLLAKSESL